jgi:photosystem II stability/assembly factor-like uncharacterized protein
MIQLNVRHIPGIRRFLRFFVLLTALWAAGITAYALDVDEIVARHTEAVGGNASLSALHSLRLVGKISFGSGDSTIELAWTALFKRPGMFREDASLQGLTAVSAYDGKEGWQVQPFEGRKDAERISADDSKALAQRADFEGPLVGWKAKGFAVSYLGTEDVDGTPALKLKVTRPSGDFEYDFLDPDYFLLIRAEKHTFMRDAEQIEEIDYSNYERVSGVWVPFAIESGPKAQPKNQRWTIESAEPNASIDDAFFQYPKSKDKLRPTSALATSANLIKPGSSTPPPPLGSASTAHFDSTVVSGLGIRNIGSATMSGRIAAIAGRTEHGKTTVFVGAASGGVWKSLDGGTTFTPVFDKQPVQSIGAIALDPSSEKTVWVGTGESWTRNSVSIGNGIYKSTDDGESWQYMGLPNSERISRIAVHPSNSDIVYACVPGKLWSDSTDRGLYKTSDGGKTWRLVLKGPNASTGCSSVTLDPSNPDVMLAGLWDFRRKGWTFRSGGDGPDAPSGSGLFRSADGGETWTELSADSAGLPAKPWGRVEVTFAPSDPKIVYAFIECKDSALYYSADGGKTWEARDKSRNMVWRPFYFARLVVDPKNSQRVFKMNLGVIVSEDGGKSFSGTSGGSHGDWHDIWIDPENPKHIIGGDDGGLWLSYDGGNRWWKGDNLPIAQFYHVTVDAADPYHVYGGLQDNGSWVGDTDYPGGISNDRWEALYGGDGFCTAIDPADPDTVYAESQGGYIGRIDRRTHSARDIQPKAGYNEKLRFSWNTPIHVSPTRRGTLYIGAQFLFRSTDRGDNWQRISPDLSTDDPNKQKQEESGGITVDNSEAEMHTSISSISESPRNSRVIWVGTDDGNLQLTTNSGRTWTNLVKNIAGLPANSWVTCVEASRFDPAVAYATFDRHTFGDMNAWVYRTSNYGRTWTRIAGPDQGLRGYAHVIREDSVSRSILFVGTEFGLWISIDAGEHWAEFKPNKFPAVAVRDLAVQSRAGDLVVATHGRGIWIIDDLSPLRTLSDAVLCRSASFLAVRPTQQRMGGAGGGVNGDAKFIGENPVSGAAVAYYLGTRHLFGPLKLEVLGADGKALDSIPASKHRGINRVVWSMRESPPHVPPAAQIVFNSSQGPHVLPGTYTVRLTSGNEKLTAPLQIELDRRAPYHLADRKAQFAAAMRVHALFGRMSGIVGRMEAARNVALADADKLPGKDELKQRLGDFATKVEGLRKKIVATKEGGAITGEERLREHADFLYGALMSWEGRPSKYQLARIDVLSRELSDVETELNGLFGSQVPKLAPDLGRKRLEPIPTGPAKLAEDSVSSADLQRGFGMFFGRQFTAPEREERD